jgi:endoglycosylceramidase
MRRGAVAALLGVSLFGLLGVPAPSTARSETPEDRLVRPLQSFTLPLGHRGRWITDAKGRIVILHGVNMVAKLAPYDPAPLGFGADDAAFLAAQGFNTVRLGIIYKGLEPERGEYDEAYLESIARTARMLGRHGIHVLVDFHQDLFNERFSGEGFPDWAVQDDGLPAQPDAGFPGNYFVMAALWRAYDHFWANDPAGDGTPLQDAFATAWRQAAIRLRLEPAVLGYDIFNEAWPGSQWTTCLNPNGCPLFDAQVTEFSRRVFDEIRKADPTKLVFYETHPIFGGGADVSIGDTGDDNAGFSFHVYCLGSTVGLPADVLGPLACPLGVDRPFERAEAQAERTGDALLLSEFGATDELGSLLRDVEAADRHMMSWQYWSYWNRDVCCERPHEGIVHDLSLPPEGDNVKQEKLDVLVRPYPRAVAGVPTSYAFHPDREDRLFELAYETDPSIRAPTEVFVPVSRHYPGGYQVTVTGPARITSAPGAALLRLRTTGPGAVQVTITR